MTCPCIVVVTRESGPGLVESPIVSTLRAALRNGCVLGATADRTFWLRFRPQFGCRSVAKCGYDSGERGLGRESPAGARRGRCRTADALKAPGRLDGSRSATGILKRLRGLPNDRRSEIGVHVVRGPDIQTETPNARSSLSNAIADTVSTLQKCLSRRQRPSEDDLTTLDWVGSRDGGRNHLPPRQGSVAHGGRMRSRPSFH